MRAFISTTPYNAMCNILINLPIILDNSPKGVTKGLVAEKVFTSLAVKGKLADFVLCIGDDRSDEDMFEIIGDALSRNIISYDAKVFACTVGQKPSKAKYYLDDTSEVVLMLDSLADATDTPVTSDDEPADSD
ncbi:hypothetical protein MTR67_032780 [Solanum verrucosum]|uniref:Uncharacterized protein n=1 Tax=Solanum verrucosum TaxID=315347 RepID=A0AAF0ZIC7_SOLVR|nr:hypothetical protein MTR67_032780 [Solanum verrucosum]